MVSVVRTGLPNSAHSVLIALEVLLLYVQTENTARNLVLYPNPNARRARVANTVPVELFLVIAIMDSIVVWVQRNLIPIAPIVRTKMKMRGRALLDISALK